MIAPPVQKRRIRPGEDMIILLLFGLVAVQLYFVLTGGPTTVIPVSRQDNATALQGRDPSIPVHDTGTQQIGNGPQPVVGGGQDPNDPLAGVSVGGIPVGLGEAVTKLPDQGNAKGVNAPPRPGAVPGAQPTGNQGHGGAREGAGGADAYRQMLLGLYYLEREGGKYAMSPAQARHLLKLIQQMETLKDAVPETQDLLADTLTKEQLEYIGNQRAIAEAQGQRFSPEEMDEYAAEALKHLGGK